MRLKELEKEGSIESTEEERSPIMVLWRLTPKGKETIIS
jgi:DNA-binding HxlR family transcriptional regulator